MVLLERLINIDPTKRPTANEILRLIKVIRTTEADIEDITSRSNISSSDALVPVINPKVSKTTEHKSRRLQARKWLPKLRYKT